MHVQVCQLMGKLSIFKTQLSARVTSRTLLILGQTNRQNLESRQVRLTQALETAKTAIPSSTPEWTAIAQLDNYLVLKHSRKSQKQMKFNYWRWLKTQKHEDISVYQLL